MVYTLRNTVTTKAQGDAHDVTGVVIKAVADSGLSAGIATVFVVGSTAGITTIEFESGVIADLGRALEIVAPVTGNTSTTCAGMTTTARVTCARRSSDLRSRSRSRRDASCWAHGSRSR